ncbi:MAG: hypothetical protein M0Z52_07780 [Actinomycetota bacterium]|nr:hypothetical protein [Actinomycetota bacterium]
MDRTGNAVSWYAVYTKPKAEDIVAGRLSLSGIKTLNPKLSVHKLVAGKRHDTVESLFPCYIFAEFNPNQSLKKIFYTQGVRYVLGGWQPLSVPGEIMDELCRRMEGGVIKLDPPVLQIGQPVMITGGMLKNFTAVFTGKANGPERVYIFLDAMNCKVEIDSWMLSKCG